MDLVWQKARRTPIGHPRHASRRRGRLPWPAALFLLTLLLPPETYFGLGDLVVSPQRILLLIGFFPWAIAVATERGPRFHLSDALLTFNVLWVTLTFCVNHGFVQGMKSGGIYIVEVLGPYLLARRYIVDAGTFSSFVRLLTWIVLFLALFTIPEALTGRNFIREGFARMVGSPPFVRGSDERLGLVRAYGSFPHPILYGVFCSSALALTWYESLASGRRIIGRGARAVGVTISTVMSVSTGALVSLAVQALLILWDNCAHRIKRRWWVLIALFAGGYITIDILSNRDPISVFISYATLNPQTGYDRQLIWTFGSAEVERHPIFGIGFNDWTRPAWMYNASMDNFWLVMAVRHGLPALLSFAAAVIWTSWKVGRARIASDKIRLSRRGWCIAMLSLSIAAMTVHLLSSALTFYCILLGAGSWLFAAQRPERDCAR